MSNERITEIVLSIDKAADLTDKLHLLHCQKFIAFRKGLSKETAAQIVKLIQEDTWSATQKLIGVHLLSGLPEEDYWDVTSSLLLPTTSEEVLSTVLLQPLPYGPSYANAYRDDTIKTKLILLKNDKRIGDSVKRKLELILTREAARVYKDYLKHPRAYGYQE